MTDDPDGVNALRRDIETTARRLGELRQRLAALHKESYRRQSEQFDKFVKACIAEPIEPQPAPPAAPVTDPREWLMQGEPCSPGPQPAPLDPQAWRKRVLGWWTEEWSSEAESGCELQKLIDQAVAALTADRAARKVLEQQIKAADDKIIELRRSVENGRAMWAGCDEERDDLRAQLAAALKERDEARTQRNAVTTVAQRIYAERDAARREKHAHAAEVLREAIGAAHRFQDLVGWQPGESRNWLVQEINERIGKLADREDAAAREAAKGAT